MLKLKEVALQLGFTESAIRKWVKSGKMKAVKICSEWRVEQSEVDRFKKGVK